MVSSLILSPDTAGASEAFASLYHNFYLAIGKKTRSDTMSCLKEKKGRLMNEIVVFITASKETEAVTIAKALVEARLAGCVNIIRGIRSIYRWQGNIEDDKEVLLIAKTTKKLFNSLEKKVKELHSYSVPEIIAMPITEGSKDYLQWLNDATA
jgi:periplasmic divalent cation tolerance protein